MALCKKCGSNELQAEFYKSINTYCKVHWKEKVTANRNSKADYYRAYDRARGNRQDISYVREFRSRFPEKYKAHSAVNNAVKSGRLKKLPCIVCGSLSVEAHHPDYSSPLDVVWMCAAHHKQTHAMVKK